MFSTRELKGDSTVWTREGATSIGNVIIDMIDARPIDGFIAIATHGNGVYSTYYDPTAGVDDASSGHPLVVGNLFPNPLQDAGTVEIVSDKTMRIKTMLYSTSGKLVKQFPDKAIHQGRQNVSIQFDELPPGVYYLSFDNGKEAVIKKVVKVACE